LTATRNYLSGHTSHISCTLCHADLALTTQIISKGFTGRHGRAFLVTPSADHPLLPTLPNTTLRAPVQRHLVTGLHTVSDVACSLCGAVLGWKYVAAADEAQRYKVGKFILESRRVCVGSLWEEQDDDGDDDDDDDDDGGGGGWSDQEGVAVKDGNMFASSSKRRPSRRGSGMTEYGAGEEGWDHRRERKASLCERQMSLDGRLGSLGARRTSFSNPANTSSTSAPTTPAKKKAATPKPQLAANIYDDEILFDSQDSDECEDLFAGVWSPRLALARRRRKRRLMGSVGGGGGVGVVSDNRGTSDAAVVASAGPQAASLILNTGAGRWGWG